MLIWPDQYQERICPSFSNMFSFPLMSKSQRVLSGYTSVFLGWNDRHRLHNLLVNLLVMMSFLNVLHYACAGGNIQIIIKMIWCFPPCFQNMHKNLISTKIYHNDMSYIIMLYKGLVWERMFCNTFICFKVKVGFNIFKCISLVKLLSL